MTENNVDFFTARHKLLKRIAAVSNFLAWFALISYTVNAGVEVLSFVNQFSSYELAIAVLAENPYSQISFPFYIFNILLQGVVYWVVLKGISLGLNMIVETNLNYQEKDFVEDDDDLSEPILYKTKEVLWIDLWLNRVAILAIVITILVNIPGILTIQRVVLSYFQNSSSWVVASWLIAILFSGLGIALQSFVYYFCLKALATILKIVMKIEVVSRATK